MSVYSMNTETDTYHVLGDLLAEAGVSQSVAELHGGICGAICVGGIESADHWVDGWLDDGDCIEEKLPTIAETLGGLKLDAWRSLAGSDMSFEPLLPDENESIQLRVRELALWCHGFICSLGLSGLELGCSGERRAQLEEIVRDFSEISKAQADAADESDEAAKFSLAELVEYVRVSVQIVYEDLQPSHMRGRSQRIH